MEIKDFKERTSVKNFDKNPMPKADIQTITEIINNAPTSTNAQQFSAIIVTDQKDKEWIAKNNWNQQHIADSAAFIIFLADRTRAKYGAKKFTNNHVAMHEIYRGVVDATIAATYAHDALITMGYGVTFVGGVVAFADKIHQKFNLPDDAQVIVGLSFGKATKINDFKPKMNKVFLGSYDRKETMKELKRYDEEMSKYYAKRGEKHDFIAHQANMIGEKENKHMTPPFTKGGQYFASHIKQARKKYSPK